MSAIQIFPAGAHDLPCLGCDRTGQSWAYRAEVVIKSGVLADWMCWRCFDEWREIPERENLPPASRRALGFAPDMTRKPTPVGPFSFNQPRSAC